MQAWNQTIGPIAQREGFREADDEALKITGTDKEEEKEESEGEEGDEEGG